MRRLFLLLVCLPQIVMYHNVLLPVNACADSIDIRTEFEYLNTQSESTDRSTGDMTESDFSGFTQLYNLNVSKSIYPNLTVSGGGIFETEDSRSTSEGSVTERTDERIRPFIDLNLRSQTMDAGAGFNRTRLREKITNLPTAKNYQEDLNTFLKWRPAGLPLVRLFYDQTHNYDDIGSVDQVEDAITLKMNYIVQKKHPLNYTYARVETEDRINNVETLVQTHDANAGYSRSFFKQRLIMDTNYKIRHRNTKFTGAAADVETALSPFAGLYSADDSPQDGPTLATATALIDGNLTAAGPANIGWTAAADEDRNIGVDFGISVRVDKIHIYVDRSLPVSASGSFTWAVYTSPDNIDTSTWTLHGVFPAVFGTFQNRFEISIPPVSTRFIKVVTSPLPSTFIIDPSLENIFITEMETFTIISTADQEDTDSVDHNFGFNLTGRPSKDMRVGYNFFYTLRETDPATERSSLSNGVYANVIIDKVFSYIARFARDDNESTVDANNEKSITYTYSAMLKAAWLETFEQILAYSGNEIEQEEGKSDSNTIFLRNNAKLYKGWDAFVDLGYSWGTPLEGGETTASSLRTGTTVVPNNKINFDLAYTLTNEKVKNGVEASTSKQELDFRTLFYPYRTLSLFAKFNIQESDDEEETRIFQNYLASWSPFPDGDLQFFLTYNETLRSADNQEDRVMGPSMKWNITSHAYLDMFYFLTKVESPLQESESKSFKVTLTVTF